MNSIISNLFGQAFQHFQNGSLNEAEILVKKILQIDSKNFEAFQILGIIKASQNKPEDAITAFKSALKINPLDGGLQFNLAKAYMDSNQHVNAITIHKNCLKIMPENPDAWINYGTSNRCLGQHEQALQAYEKATELSPNDPEAWSNYAVSLNDLKRHTEALEAYNKSISINCNIPATWYNKGITLEDLGMYLEAVHAYDRAIILQADYPAAHSNRGGALIHLKRYEEAIKSYARALSYKQDDVEILTNYGSALNEVGQYLAALEVYQNALNISPAEQKTLFCQGITLHELGQYDKAISSFEAAKELNPSTPYLLGNLVFNKATVCNWKNYDQNIDEIQAQLSLGNNPIPPFYALSILDSESLQKKVAELWVSDHIKNIVERPFPSKAKSKKIKLGYFSADFRNHAVSILLAGVFESHNKDEFEVIAFSFGSSTEDAMSRRIKSAFSEFIDISNLTDIEVIEIARRMEIDIAIDLSGFTKNFRVQIFANRVAPIQINYLGYSGTMGADFIDYIVADKYVIPEKSRGNYSEKIIYLPNSFMANDSTRAISQNTISKSLLGISEDTFVFCCFNNSYKISPVVFSRWLNILKRTKNTVLWISASNLMAQDSIIEATKKAGLDSNRIIFAKRVTTNEDHLARLGVADLFLDTLPYNAHTTAADALWAGVPVLTCTGNTFAGRVATSLLYAIDLPELVASDPYQYEELAVELANSPDKIRLIKKRLTENRFKSPLFNTLQFTLDLEIAYKAAYTRFCNNLSTDHIFIN